MKKLYSFIFLTLALAGIAYAAQVAIVSTDTRNEAWSKETLNNTDLQDNIDTKATTIGTPVNNQLGIWTGDGTIEGDIALTFDTSTDTLSVPNIIATTGISTGASSDPKYESIDSDAAAGTSKFYANSSGAYDVIMYLGVEDSTGESTHYIEVDGASETVDMLKPTTLQAGDVVLAEMAVNSVGSDQYIDGSIDAVHLSTSAQVINTITSFSSPTVANPYTLTAANSYNAKVYYGADGEIDLPALADGMAVVIYNTGAFTITMDPNASEVVVRDGTAQTGGVSFTLSAGAGNFVCIVSDGTQWVTLGFKGTLAVGT